MMTAIAPTLLLRAAALLVPLLLVPVLSRLSGRWSAAASTAIGGAGTLLALVALFEGESVGIYLVVAALGFGLGSNR